MASTRSNEGKKPISMKKRDHQAVIMEKGNESVTMTSDGIMFTEGDCHSNTFVPPSEMSEHQKQLQLNFRKSPQTERIFVGVANDSGSLDRAMIKSKSSTSEFLQSTPETLDNRKSVEDNSKISGSVYKDITPCSRRSAVDLNLDDIAELDEEILKIDQEIKKIKRN